MGALDFKTLTKTERARMIAAIDRLSDAIGAMMARCDAGLVNGPWWKDRERDLAILACRKWDLEVLG